MKTPPPVGRVFGRLTVVAESRTRSKHWQVKCACGAVKEVNVQSVKRGLTRSCGCLRSDLSRARRGVRIPFSAGDVFGRLTVVEPAATRHYWVCLCECGTITTVWKYSLTTGGTTSCGCYSREAAAKRFTTHGLTHSPEYVVWSRMIQRCRNPRNSDFPMYGGVGITVCERWLIFDAFLADLGRRPSKRHSLNRSDNARGYEPGNVAWATATEQGRNKRNNRMLTLGGVTLTLAGWCERAGLTRAALNHRLQRGWTMERALTTPPR